jgi:hypothetical protein
MAESEGQWLVIHERIGPGTSSWQRKLAEGWEPFAVSGDDKYGIMWFKRWMPKVTK